MQPVRDRALFPARERIKSSMTIKDVMDDKQSVFVFPVKCFYRIVEGDTSAQLAIVVSKHRFKHAVDRNRVKRLLREAYRHQKQMIELPEGQTLQMCWIYVGKDLPDSTMTNTAVESIFRKIQNTL